MNQNRETQALFLCLPKKNLSVGDYVLEGRENRGGLAPSPAQPRTSWPYMHSVSPGLNKTPPREWNSLPWGPVTPAQMPSFSGLEGVQNLVDRSLVYKNLIVPPSLLVFPSNRNKVRTSKSREPAGRLPPQPGDWSPINSPTLHGGGGEGSPWVGQEEKVLKRKGEGSMCMVVGRGFYSSRDIWPMSEDTFGCQNWSRMGQLKSTFWVKAGHATEHGATCDNKK